MRLHLVSLSLAALLLSVTPTFLPPLLTLSPLAVQAQTPQDKKTEADRLLNEGIELYNNINFDGALGRFEEALLIYQEIGDKIGEGTTLQEIGRAYYSMEQYQKASDYYQRALAVQRDAGDGAGARRTLTSIGRIYDRLGDYQQALDYYQQAVAIPQEPSKEKQHSAACRDRDWQGVALQGIGRVYQRLADYQQSFDYYQQALAMQQELSDCADEDLIPSYAKGATLFYNTGFVAQELGKYQEALDSYQQALAIYQELDDSDEQGLILSKMGGVYRKLGEYQKAIDAFKQAEEMNFLIRNFGQGGTFNNIGLVYYELGDYQQALDLYQKALAFAQAWRGGEMVGEAVSLNNIGGAYHKLEKYQQALDSYQKSLAIMQELEDKKGEGVTLHNIGAVYDKQGKYQQALDSYQKALAIFQDIGNKTFEVVTLNNIGLTYDHLGESQQAQNYYQRALELQEGIGDKTEQAKPSFPITLNLEPQMLPKSPDADREAEEIKVYQTGIQLRNRGQAQEALETFQKALGIARELGNQTREWYNLNQIGLVYNSLGEYKLALDFFNQALAIPKAAFEYTGEIHYNIGRVYSYLGNYSKALEFYQQASAIIQKRGYKAGEVRILSTIGTVHYKQEQYELALEFYQQALELLKTIDVEKKSLEAGILNNIAKVYIKQGKYELALNLYQQALTIEKQFGSKSGEGAIFHNIGEAYYHLGQYKTALEYYQQALVISQESGNKPIEGKNLSNIGYLLEKQNKPELAIVFFKQSVNAREAIRESIKGLPQEQQQSYTETIAKDYRHLADLLLQQNRILEAQRVLDLLKVQELDDYLRNVRGSRETVRGVPNLSSEQQIEDGYQKIIDEAIALGKELTQLRQKNNRTPQEEQRLTQLVKAQEKITENFNNFIESDEVETLISQLTPKTRKPDLVDDLEDLLSIQDNLKNLQQNAVLLYPLILEDRLELILTTPDSPPIRRTVPVTKKQLNQAIVDFRQALRTPTSDAKTPAQQLYNWLIKPLENDLATAEAKTIIYAPDGQLRYIPLAALHDGEQWLVQRYRINNITATSLTELNTQPQPQLKILAGAFTQGRHSFTIGQERFDFGGLPYAGVEVETLAETIPNTTQLLNNAFNPEDTKPKMGDYTVLHFATHGAIMVGTPEESFILFGDGTPITIADIRNWNLNNVDLVVLSACETGLGGILGNGEEILGLGYQMQRAGARAAIASLWTVNDGSTQVLMNTFYAVLKTEKVNKTEALRQAQIALITGDNQALGEQRGISVVGRIRNNSSSDVQNRLTHPYYWAPFILIGNGL